MKKELNANSKIIAIAATVAMGLGSACLLSFADDTPPAPPAQEQGTAPQHHHHHRHHRRFGQSHGRHGFGLGLCVGQALSKEGVSLPARQPGTPPQVDEATRTAFKAAIEQCRQQLHNKQS